MDADDVVQEYLQHQGLFDTWECFKSERIAADLSKCSRKRINAVPNEVESKNVESLEGKVSDDHARWEIMTAFDEKNTSTFFELWNLIFQTSSENRKLHFDLQLHFFCCDAKVGNSFSNFSEKQQRLATFLQTSGAAIAKEDASLCVYFALPHVDEPKLHPVFKHIYDETFVADVRNRLVAGLATRTITRKSGPKLLELIQQEHRLKKIFAKSVDEANESRENFMNISKRLFSVAVMLTNELETIVGSNRRVNETKTQLSQIRASMSPN